MRGEWRVETLADAALAPGSAVTMKFGADDRLSGKASCNRYSASYETDGDRLSVGPAAATRMACAPPLMQQEARFLSLLAGVRRWSVAGGALTLYSEDGARALRARRI